MQFVVVHVPNPYLLMNAASKYLKPNGIILVEDSNMEGFVSSTPLYACTLLHEAHIQVSLKLGGSYLKEAGFNNIQCHVFTPLFGKWTTVQQWCLGGEAHD
jgi:2-polyprenyl-3-methyl-5-hydroxy-6-metoxy-1,4-benzoquinol methylase